MTLRRLTRMVLVGRTAPLFIRTNPIQKGHAMGLIHRYRLPLLAVLAIVGAMASLMSSAHADVADFTAPHARCTPGNPTSITHKQEHSEGQNYWSYSATAVSYCSDTYPAPTAVKAYVRIALYYDMYVEKSAVNTATYGPHTLPLGEIWTTPADRRTGYLTSCVHNHYYYIHTNTFYWYKSGSTWLGPTQYDHAINVGISGRIVMC